MDKNIETVTLTDEQGIEKEFDVITYLEAGESEYLIVTPKDEEAEDAIALKVVNQFGEEVLCSVDDEEEFQMVAEAYELLFQE